MLLPSRPEPAPYGFLFEAKCLSPFLYLGHFGKLLLLKVALKGKNELTA
jgi:hypothetical protein